MPPYGEGTTATQPPPSNQRQMSAPQAQMGNGGGNGNGKNTQQQQHPQMGGPNPYGGYPGQQQHHRGGMNGMAMQPPGGIGNPGFMQGHRNSMGNSMAPPPMNMGHQYSNQGGYGNPNFNQQGAMGQQQQQQYGHQQQQQQQQHGYPQQHMGMPGQQQHGMQHQQLQHGHPGQQRQQHQGNFHPNQQQQQQQAQQRTQHPPPQQPYGQQPGYGRQNSSNVSQQTDVQTSSGTSGPLNFNSAPGINNPSNPSPAPGGNNPSVGPGGPAGGVGGPGGDYGQQFLPSGLNGDWQSDGDMHHRREMIQHIVKLLKQKDKNASPEWLTKLPQMVKQLEVSLYRSAPSFEAYSDTSTLKSRLQQLAMEIAKKTQQAKDGSGSDGGGGGGGQSSRGGQGSRRSSGGNNNGPSQGMGPMIGGNNFNMPSGPGRGSNDAGADAISSQHGNPNDPEWKVRIRHKQQRLLLLHHSSKCPYEDGKCKVTPYCGEMKKLWKHMARCTDNECRVPHCFSSRSILSHYRKCKDAQCPACGPVRETVRKTQKSQRTSRGNTGGVGGGSQAQQQGGMGGNQIQMSSDASIGINMGNNSNNYAMPDLSGMQNNNNMGGNPIRQQSNTNAANGVGSNNPMGNNMMGGPQGRVSVNASQIHNGMPVMGNNNNNSMGGGNNTMGVGNQQMNNGLMDGMMNGNRMNNGSMQPNSMGSMFPGQQNNKVSNMGGPPQQQSQSGGIGSQTNQNGSNTNNSNLPSHSSMMPPPPSSDSNDPITTSSNNANGSRNKPEPDAKARHKRQRLLLLRHASKCTAANGLCTVTPHCAEMKVLWKHIANCKDSYCKVRHCMSSRYVLSHYRRCKPPCNICDPVKEIIKNGFNDVIQVDPAIMEGSGSGTGGLGSGGVVQSTPPPPPVSLPAEQPPTKRQRPNPAPPGSMPPPLPIPSAGPPSSMPPPQSLPNKPKPNPPVPTKPPSLNKVAKPSSPKPIASSPVEDHALLECFTTEQVKTHIQSLKKFAKLAPAELKGKCLEVLKGLQTHEHGWVFATPVNPVELGLDDYFEIIKKPMDLGTIQKKLDGGSFHSFDDFRSDVRLTFENAMKYNEEQTPVHEMAKELKKKFETDFKKLMKQLDKDHAENSKKVQACGLCGCEKLNFEPPVFFCNGPNCPTKRIRRNTNFYITADKQHAWCNQCFGDLKGDTIELGTTKVNKADLTKRKNDEVHEESWVQCDDCERWIHQICGLYNTRQDKENTSAYSCPLCLLDKRKKEDEGLLKPSTIPEAPSANDIPRTKLSDWLERDVHTKVDTRMRELAEEKAESENISYEKAYKALSAGGPLTIRQVTSTDRKHEVRDLMKARYAHKNYPGEFPYRCKCIVVFQNIDGVDVVLFALYVYEHGEDNPLPNKRTVYVSYLDSVHFMKPRKMRTFIYHEILISYLDYARDKGYQQAFIWACPPLKGDDYIFYAKPEDQKTPKDVRLRQWYLDMLEDCQRRNIVGKVSNMYDQYFNDKSLDAAVVPYFEGDYFPGEAENIIKELNEEGTKKGSGGGKKKSSSKSKKSSDTITAASSVPEKSYKDGGRDPVMQKFCSAIEGMKESFIVAFLNCKNAKPENLIVPKEIADYREQHPTEIVVKTEDGKPTSRKRDANGNEIPSSANQKQFDRLGRPIRVLDDDTEEIDCEFFNTRQSFLDLCRGNHYQFDELRRAKHTSMMVLWHLQNREAPKFVQQCFACAREISSGVRHHCSVCPDFDLCHECYRDPKANRGQCNHTLETIKVDAGERSSGLTEEQRKERQRNIQLHIALIEHASQCVSPKCTSTNCQKMKSFLKHGQTCKIKASGGCRVCKRIWTLLRIHAQQCKNSNCSIRECIAIRKRIRQLQLKQRAMDDRRRQEMNRHYRLGMMSS